MVNAVHPRVSRLEAEGKLEGLARMWRIVSLGIVGIMTGGSLGRPDVAAGDWREDVLAAKNKLVSGERTYGSYLSQIVLFDRDAERVEEGLRSIRTAVQELGFTARIERENRTEAYLASLPGEVDASDFREAFASSRQVAHSISLSARWSGPVRHPNARFGADADPLFWAYIPGRRTFRGCLHVDELGHTAIFGMPRSGKSVLLNMLMQSHLSRYAGSRVFAYDVDWSLYKQCVAKGGRHYAIGADGGRLALLQGINDPKIREARARMIEQTILRPALGGTFTPTMRAKLDEALRVLAGSGQEQRLGWLANLLQDEGGMREIVGRYEGGELDGVEDDLDFAGEVRRGRTPLFVFEYGAIKKVDSLLAPFVAYTQDRIWSALEAAVAGSASGEMVEGASANGEAAGTAPSMILFDEAHVALKGNEMTEFVETLGRRAPKMLAQIVLASHAVTDLLNSPIGEVLPDLIATVIAARDPEALQEPRRSKYMRFGLNDRDLSDIARLSPGWYFLKNASGSASFTLDLSPFEVAWFGGASPEDRKLVNRLIAEHGIRNLVPAYLRARGPDFETHAEVYERLGLGLAS